jgi:GH43 family beta-xylosidase
LSRAEDLICRHDDRFRFADARRPEQQKTSARTAGLRQAEFAALNRRDDARQHLGLAANLVWQQRIQFLELVKFVCVYVFIHPPLLAGILF